MTPGWLAAAVETFWDQAGAPPPAPRDLAAVLEYGLTVSYEVLPGLTVASVEGWIARRFPAFRFDTTPRALRGCLVAYRGQGLIFVDGNDDPAEQRFTLAHEIAHYLLDYHIPREETLRRLGPSILPVLDGERSPRLHERIDASLTAMSLSYYVHLFDRGRADGIVDLAERRADELAFELLAPADELQASVGSAAEPDDVVAMLTGRYGLPEAAAQAHARSWLRQRRAAPSDFGWLRR